MSELPEPATNNKQGRQKLPLKVVVPIVLVLVVGLSVGLMIWKSSSSDDLDEILGGTSSGASSTNKSSKNTSADNSSGKIERVHSATKRFGPEESFRSPLIAMAVARRAQMRRLDAYGVVNVLDPKATPLMGGAATKSASYADEVALRGRVKLELFEQLRSSRKRLGETDPFWIEKAVDVSLVMEQLNEDSLPLVTNAAKNWLLFVDQLLAYKDAKTHNQSSKVDSAIKKFGMLKVCHWAHDTGELLAMILWGHHRNSEAAQIIKRIPEIYTGTSFQNDDVVDSASDVHRLLTLSRLCASQNEYGLAKASLTSAKDMAAKKRSALIVNREQLNAMCLLEESRLSLSQQDFSAAAELAREALKLQQNAIDMDRSQGNALRADVLEQLARSLSAFPEKISEAIVNQEACLKLKKDKFGTDGINNSATALDLARMLRQRMAAAPHVSTGSANTVAATNDATIAGSSPSASPSDSADARRAREIISQILSVCSRNQKVDIEVLRSDRNASLLLPQTYYELGFLEAACGRFAEARQAFQKAYDLDMAFSEPSRVPFKVADMDAIASLDLRDGKIELAREKVLKASMLIDQYVDSVLPQLSLAEQIAFTNNIERHMNSLLSVCADDKSLAPLYGEMVRAKGFLLEQFRLRSLALKQRSNAEISELMKQHQMLSSEILNSTVLSAQGGTAGAVVANQKRKEELEREINERLRGEQQNQKLTSKDLQNCLADDEAIMDFYEFASSPWSSQVRYGAIIASHNQIRWVDLGLANKVNDAVNAWRSFAGVRTVLTKPTAADGKNLSASNSGESTDAWTQLRGLVYDPLTKAIPVNISRLWVSDESALTRMPWSLLMSDFGGSKDYQVCQVDSPRELINLKRATKDSSARKDLLLIGGIDFSKHVPPAPPLKHAVPEMQEIQKEMLHGKIACAIQSDSVQSFPNASKPIRKNVMNGLANCRFAHIVTHGFFNDTSSGGESSDHSAADAFQMPSRNPLTESGLLIGTDGDSNHRARSDNGFLTAEDLLDADLQGCRLVTLSACDTARGRELSSQGVLGLRSALMGAGTKCVLLSLWPVPDKPSSELMKVFYQKMINGDSPVIALRKAQSAIRSNEKWQAPYYWAAWIIVGDGWEKLLSKT